MRGRWRVFRHEAGREAGPPAWAYVALFSVCMLVGHWSAATFQAVVIWPANGVMLAALLQLKRRQAVATLATCLAINLVSNVVRGDPMPFLWLNAVLNMAQVILAAVIARRVCGAALDLRRPRRLVAFGLLAITPAVALSALIATTLAAVLRDQTLPIYLFSMKRYFDMELLGLLIVTPTLLLLARAHRFADTGRTRWPERIGLHALLVIVAAFAFGQNMVPVLFLVFLPLLLIVFRLSPPNTAVAVLILAAIGGFATLNGHGPIPATRLLDIAGLEAVPPILRQLSVYNLFLLAVVVTALPASTVMSERRRLIVRLKARTEAAHAARLRAEQADAAKSRFLALMSHEMRTPLHSVVGYAEVLGRRPELKAEARRQAALIQVSGAALLVLVEDVLEVSRGTDILCFDTVRLEDILTQAVASSRDLADSKGLTLVIEVDPDAAAPVMTDPKRLRQAIHKLVCNAVKFTDAGHVRLHAARQEDIVSISVCDTGCGIDPAVLPGIFDPFVQGDDSIGRRHVGAGLGLTVARRMAERLDGRIEATSRLGHGSTFTIILPLPPLDLPTETPVAEPDSVPVAAPRVLVVDDHPANREVARLMLALTGAEVVEACDGLEAVEIVQAQSFDLILMDVRMPRMDGLAAARAIRALPGPVGSVPILAVTADAMPEDAARCLAAGMNGHLAKPITHASLYAAIDRVMADAAVPAEGVAA